MMSWIKSMTAGFAGAVALNVVHEVLRKNFDNVPQINLVGEEALNKTLSAIGKPIRNKEKLHTATLEADIFSNAVYYSLIGGSNNYVWPRAIVLGLSAGIGALTLPKPLGLNPRPVTKTTQTKILTVGYYVFGAMVTALVFKKLISKS